MRMPEINGLEVLGQVGSGESGMVLAARDNRGNMVAAKVFEAMAVNRALLSRMVARLESGGWPEGVAEIQAADFEGRPTCWVLPLYADEEQGQWKPRSLQHRLEDVMGRDPWELVREIAKALAAMHARRVAHGNLKPGNVFFTEDGRVRLTDWTLGNMPGIIYSGATDAWLYQPPEQLMAPEGYLDEAGYRWDVFAFGTLAFRLLTGTFPRCHEEFEAMAPLHGGAFRKENGMDAAKLSELLIARGDVEWDGQAGNRLAARYFDWIIRCLHLDAFKRPADMQEVLAGFVEAEREVRAEMEREKLLDQRRHADRRVRRVMVYAVLATTLSIVLGGLWKMTRDELGGERLVSGEKIARLEKERREADAAKQVVLGREEEARRAMEYERELGLARLESSRLVGDRLFEWAMEKGHRSLPPLDGRELRLQRLERYFEDFLARTENIAALGEERARVRMQLAEISLSAGSQEKAEQRLSEAIKGWEGQPMDNELKMRWARNALLLALLKKEKNEEDALKEFGVARSALEALPQSEVDGQRLSQWLSILDFHEAKLLAAKGDEGGALERLLRATKTLNELADARPESVVLRSELAACYLSSATILEGMGQLGDAREVRRLAAAELVELIRKDPQDVGLRLELAGCYSALAEAAVLAGDVASAEEVAAEAMKLLDQILRQQPDSNLAVARKAGLLGVQAGLLRDRGESEPALAAFEEGIRLLERLQPGGDDRVRYRLALLLWQKGRMLGFGGQAGEEIALLGKAREGLRALESKDALDGVMQEDLQRSGAYLAGDYAHALELSGKKDEAKAAYADAVELWERLARMRPKSEEYQEGLEWIRQRAKAL